MRQNVFKLFLILIVICTVFLFKNQTKAESKTPELTMSMMSQSPCDPVLCPAPIGALPPDANSSLSNPFTASHSGQKATSSPLGACWKDDPKARIAPVSWYWPVNKNIHLQIYDSTGAWWYNGWVKSNSYTVFSKDGKGQYPGIPTDGRTVYARVSYGGPFSAPGQITCFP